LAAASPWTGSGLNIEQLAARNVVCPRAGFQAEHHRSFKITSTLAGPVALMVMLPAFLPVQYGTAVARALIPENFYNS